MTNDTTTDDDEEGPPPTASRVAARALVLAVVSCRGFIDVDAAEAGDFWSKVKTWFLALDLDDELEDWEKAVITRPLGTLSDQERADAAWLSEGMLVLAWALGRHPIPPYDEAVVAADAAETLGLLKPRAETVLTNPVLRSSAELEEFSQDIFLLHWRLREFALRPRPIDFATLAKTAWFGSMSLARVRLIDGDLAIGIERIDKADESLIRLCSSIAIERHRAINWLVGGSSDIYSEVDTST